MLLTAIGQGIGLLTWESDAFAYADSYDEATGRYRGLRGGQAISLPDANASGLLVKPDAARRQLDAEVPKPRPIDPTPNLTVGNGDESSGQGGGDPPIKPKPPIPVVSPPKRFHGTVVLDSARVGRDASRIAEEVIAHLSGIVGARVRVTLEVEAEIPEGATDQVVRTVTENSRTLKFTSLGSEKE